jgi:hypothetical protein
MPPATSKSTATGTQRWVEDDSTGTKGGVAVALGNGVTEEKGIVWFPGGGFGVHSGNPGNILML